MSGSSTVFPATGKRGEVKENGGGYDRKNMRHRKQKLEKPRRDGKIKRVGSSGKE